MSKMSVFSLILSYLLSGHLYVDVFLSEFFPKMTHKTQNIALFYILLAVPVAFRELYVARQLVICVTHIGVIHRAERTISGWKVKGKRDRK